MKNFNYFTCEILKQLTRAIEFIEFDDEIAEWITTTEHPIVCLGIGKSGFIMQKFSASLNSLGIRSVFISPMNALHGDIGFVVDESLCILMSNSGTSDELAALLPNLRTRKAKTILFTGNMKGSLVNEVDKVVFYGEVIELDTNDLVPTTSTALQMLITDALIGLISEKIVLSKIKFARNHPAGSLGLRLRFVKEVMVPSCSSPTVRSDTTLLEVIQNMNKLRIGAACVLDEDGKLLGIITDGDIRRSIGDNPHGIFAHEIMNNNPKTISAEAQFGEVLDDTLLSEMNCLPVLDNCGTYLGLLIKTEVK